MREIIRSLAENWFIWLLIKLDYPYEVIYATGRYNCGLCGQEQFFSGRLDDEFSFTRPKICHVCQREICVDCKKALEEIVQHGEF
jgi:hypothetical protein